MERFDQLKSNLQNIINEFSGKVGIIVKVDGEEIFSKYESKVFQSASLIKLFILEALLEKISQGELSYSDKKSVDSMDKVPGFGVLKVLDNNLNVTIKDLATLMITLSDNTATNMLIDILGIDYIQ
ncbi:MAG: serine hydrolase, partial [Cetobacterium sp.]